MDGTQSIEDQLRAIFSWITDALEKEKQAFESNNLDKKSSVYSEVRTLLKDVQKQSRNLERRKNGLRKLPKMEEVDKLKKLVTEIRAAVAFLSGTIGKLEKLIKKEKSGIDMTSVRVKEQVLYRDLGTYSREIQSLVLRSKEIINEYPWVNPVFLIRPENGKALYAYLFKKGYYKDLDDDDYRNILGQGDELYYYDFRSWDLSELNFSVFHDQLIRITFLRAKLNKIIAEHTSFIGCYFYATKFNEAHLERSKFLDCDISHADFEEAELKYATFKNCILEAANFTDAELIHVDFTDSDLQSANFKDADVRQADFSKARNLTKEQISEAKYWVAAKGIPDEWKPESFRKS